MSIANEMCIMEALGACYVMLLKYQHVRGTQARACSKVTSALFYGMRIHNLD